MGWDGMGWDGMGWDGMGLQVAKNPRIAGAGKGLGGLRDAGVQCADDRIYFRLG